MIKLEQPLNANERYLYAIVERLDKVIELFESKEEKVMQATVVNDKIEVEEKPVKRARKKK